MQSTQYAQTIEQIAQLLADTQKPICLVTHVDPDGDAIGSSLGLLRALRGLSKKALLFAMAPAYLQFLCEPGECHTAWQGPLPMQPEHSILVVLDCAEPSRIEGITDLQPWSLVINIDHHGTNPLFGQVVLVDPSKAATAQIVKDLIEAMQVGVTPAIATPILTGIITDTGNFRHANTTPEVLRAAADLVSYGVDLAGLTDRLQWRPQTYYKSLAAVLLTVEFHFGGALVTAHMPPEARFQDDSDDFVGIIRYAQGSQLAVFLRVRGNDVKVSIRSRGEISAQAIAVKLGGGGHVPAAGATLKNMTLAEGYQKVLEVVGAALG
jgi:bifunctional oligoribonuclease and PAP phosphatase NrnA